MSNDSISNLLSETRTFPPTPEFANAANIKIDAYEDASKDRLGFWERQAERLDWFEKWKTP